MEARTLATLYAAGRVGFGVALMAVPRRVSAGWVGRDGNRPGAQVLAMATGARDLGLALGTLAALRRGFGARPWLRAGVLADAADCVATLGGRDALPARAVIGVAALAGGSAVLGAYLQGAVD